MSPTPLLEDSIRPFLGAPMIQLPSVTFYVLMIPELNPSILTGEQTICKR